VAVADSVFAVVAGGALVGATGGVGVALGGAGVAVGGSDTGVVTEAPPHATKNDATNITGMTDCSIRWPRIFLSLLSRN